jgi:hypothetical protein
VEVGHSEVFDVHKQIITVEGIFEQEKLNSVFKV